MSGVLIACAFLLVFIPRDFVSTHSFWSAIHIAAQLAGPVSGAIVLILRRRIVDVIVAFYAAVYIGTLGVAAGAGFHGALLAAVVFCGYAAGRMLTQRPGHIEILLWVVALSVVIEWIFGRHVFSTFFGSPHQISGAWEAFRPRGLLGHAIPSSIAILALWPFAVSGSRTGRSAQEWVRIAVLVIVSVFAILVAGSRSALLIAVVLVIFALRRWGVWRPPSPKAVGLGLVIIGLATVTATWSGVVSSVSSARILDWEGLAGTSSVSNRLRAADVVVDRLDLCGGNVGCIVFGAGYRGLERESIGAFQLYSTVDNSFATLFYDFGVVGVLSFAIALLHFSIRALSRRESRVEACAQGIVIILIGGVFADVIYFTSLMVLLGVLAGCGTSTKGARDYTRQEWQAALDGIGQDVR